MTINKKHILEIPIENATVSKSGHVYSNKFWAFNPKTNSILFYCRGKNDALHPQCNDRESVTEYLVDKLYPEYNVIFLENVYLISCERSAKNLGYQFRKEEYV